MRCGRPPRRLEVVHQFRARHRNAGVRQQPLGGVFRDHARRQPLAGTLGRRGGAGCGACRLASRASARSARSGERKNGTPSLRSLAIDLGRDLGCPRPSWRTPPALAAPKSSQRGDDRPHLARAVGRAAQHHGEHQAAVAFVVEERLHRLAIEIGIDQRLRGDVERIGRQDEFRARARRALSLVAPAGSGSSRSEPSQKSSTIALNAPESEMTAAPPRGGDGQRIISSPRSSNSSSVSTTATPACDDQRAHDLVVAAHGAGMGLCGHARRGAAAGMQQHDRLAGRMRPARRRQEALRMAELLHHHQQDMGAFVVDQIVEEILAPVERLVAGGDRIARPRYRADAAPRASRSPWRRFATRCRRRAARPTGTGVQALNVNGMPST